MAIIYTYPVKTNPVGGDLILISDSADGNNTKQVKVSTLPSSGGGSVSSVGFSLNSIAAFTVTGDNPVTGSGTITLGTTGGSSGQYLDYQGNWSTPPGTSTGTVTGSGTANKIPKWSTGGTGIEDSIITDLGTTISVAGNFSTQGAEINKYLTDGTGSTGVDGYILSSTTVSGDKEVAWIANSSGGGISFSGTTASGILTRGGDTTANVSSNIIATASQMVFDGASGNTGLAYNSGTATFNVGGIGGGSDTVSIYSAGVETVTIASANVHFKNTSTTLFDNGIKFGAAGETLNSYEEGTWTPVMFQSSSPSVTATGNYIKIGKKVTAFFTLVCTAGGTAEISNARISGLPFNAYFSSGHRAGVSIAENTSNAANQKFIGGAPGGAATIDLKVFTSGTDYQYSQGRWPNSQGNFTVSGSYTYHAQS